MLANSREGNPHAISLAPSLGLPERPPRLVLRFAVYTALTVGLAAAGLLFLAHRYATKRAESAVRFHARFVADSILRDRLRPDDFAAPVEEERRGQLDGLFRREVLLEGGLRATLYGRSGQVTYSSDHSLIGTRAVDEGLLRAALGGKSVGDAGRLDNQDGRGKGVRVLETYAPVRLGSTVPAGVFQLDQDYGPVAAAARQAFLPIALVLAPALLLLYALLLPILHRVTGELRAHVRHVEHLARHDLLTGLPNRLLFRERLEQALESAPGDAASLAVLFLDLDRFKELNDALGHQIGDLVLREAGRRLRAAVRETDTVARLGGDEFAVLAPTAAHPDSALDLARRIARALEEPLALDGILVQVEASMGIALSPVHGRDADTLLRRADVAMYRSKKLGSGAELYAREKDHHSPDRLALIGELRRAIAQGEIVLHYQPLATMPGGEVQAVEALVRWQHRVQGLLRPDDFVPLAESSGLIRALTRHVLEEALRQCRAWAEKGIELGVAVNIAGRDLLDLRLPEEVEALVRRWQVEPGRLTLEISENAVLADPMRTRLILARLSALGVRLAIDDFGCGHASLGHLKRLPLDVLKIDRSLVLTMSDDDRDAAIVRSIIDLGHSLGLTVVAEGVETDRAWTRLAQLGCDAAQGFYVGRPAPPERLLRFDGIRAARGLRPRRAARDSAQPR